MLEKLWKDYSLSITLFILFMASCVGQLGTQWQQFVIEQNQHKQEVEVSEFVPEFFSSTFENWQSEFLQLFTMVVLTSILVHKGSTESKDGQEQMQASLDRIEKKLKSKNNFFKEN